ncbi:MAG TPA: helix-turn-helix transcriptional regulator [Kofleriaceae bacterium]
MDSRVARPTVDPCASLAMWLRAGRAQRNLTLDDVARVTKIQARILQKIEAGNLEGLPAEVFVRGFIKSFARCVGLSETEAVERYGHAAAAAKLGGTSSVARAFVETLVAAPISHVRTQQPGKPTLLVEPLPAILPEASMELEPIVLADLPADLPADLSVELQVVEPEPAPEVVVEAAPVVEAPVVAALGPAAPPAIEVVEVVADGKKKRTRKKAAAGTAAPRTRKKKGAPAEVVAAPAALDSVSTIPAIAEPAVVMSAESTLSAEIVAADFAAGSATEIAAEWQRGVTDESNAADDLFAPSDGIVIDQDLAEGSERVVSGPVKAEPIAVEPVEPIEMIDIWKPTMPPVAPSVPWKRPTQSFKTSTFTVPSLVIDDADPDIADRERDERDTAKGPHRVSFLPPILLDRDDKTSRQGGLTLAVILLLIAATLTLSYLMRRPSVSGDGVTQVEPIGLVATHPIA